MALIDNIFSNLKIKKNNRSATIDEGFFIFLPKSEEELFKKNYKLIHIVKGTYRYGSSGYWRDYRIGLTPVFSDNPVLYGVIEKRLENINKLESIIPPTAELCSLKFFGSKNCCKYITSTTIPLLVDLNPEISRIEAQNYLNSCRDNIKIKQLFDYLVFSSEFQLSNSDRKYIFESGCTDEAYDTIRTLKVLDITLETADGLLKKHNNYKQQFIVNDLVYDLRRSSIEFDLHYFVQKLEQIVERQRTKKKGLIKFKAPDFEIPSGFEFVENEKILSKVSRENGWCAGNSHYRKLASNGCIFIFSESERVLALYNQNGELQQQKAKHNNQTDIAPKTLCRSSICHAN